jgi:2-phospho-L-lactate guanylyltransferase
MWAVVPIRSFDDGKRRLAPVLDDGLRAALVEAMFLDVLDLLVGAPGLDGVLTVTRDPAAQTRAQERGVEVLEERGHGLNPALTQAAEHLECGRRDALLVVPGDVPLASRAELARIVAAHGGTPSLTLVPDREGEGTNALACSPPSLVEFCFGKGSAEAHLRQGRRRGALVRTLALPGFGLDVDTVVDLADLRIRGAHTRAGRLLAGMPQGAGERAGIVGGTVEAGG